LKLDFLAPFHQGNACGPQGGVELWKWPSGSERLDSTAL